MAASLTPCEFDRDCCSCEDIFQELLDAFLYMAARLHDKISVLQRPSAI